MYHRSERETHLHYSSQPYLSQAGVITFRVTRPTNLRPWGPLCSLICIRVDMHLSRAYGSDVPNRLKQPIGSGNMTSMKNPRPPTKHQLKSEATRSALLKAAEEIFARDGYERAQIDEIGKLSGRTRGAVYAQYKTKEQLFFALQEQRIDSAGKKMTAALAKLPRADQRLNALRELYSDLRDSDAAVLDLELKLYAVRNTASREDWREHYERMFQLDTPKFAEAFAIAEEPGRSHLRSRLLALSALKSGLILAMRFMPEEFTPKETKLLLKEIFDGLFPAPQTAAEGTRTSSSTKRKSSSRTARR